MDSGDDSVNNENVRRTRSGKIVRTPAVKAPAKKTRKKVVLMEVEVSEEEEDAQQNNVQKDERPEESEENNVPASEENHESQQAEEMEVVEEIIEETTLEEDEVALSELINKDMDQMEENEKLVDDAMDAEFAEPLAEPTESVVDEVEEALDDDVMNEQKNGVDVASDTEPEKEEEKQLQSGEPDAENISEDELPTVQAVKVPETEEVSDEELPGPKRAELPADTEVVSEDELPTVKKEATKRKLAEGDYDPGSPTSEGEAPAKKASIESTSVKEEEKNVKPKKLPELDKYWKAVNDDPTDFTGWTYLLQYVDQENDMEAAREAYDAFLSHYPYCYGYWRKYADYEKRKGNKKKCEEVRTFL
jgi:pre-mRNA-processing factor 39